MRRRLPRQAHSDIPAATQLPPEAIAPTAHNLIGLALSAMYHKNASLKRASMEVMTNFVYFVPKRVLHAVVTRFWEAQQAANSVHQIATSIRMLSGMLTRPLMSPGQSEGKQAAHLCW